MFRSIRVAAAAVPALLLLSACGGAGSDSDASDPVTVAAGFYPLAWVAAEVGGADVEVTNLTAAGQDPHDAELSLSQTARVAAADLVLLTGDLQPAVRATAEQNAEGLVVDTADLVELRPLTAHDHAHGDAEDHEGDEHGDGDPHFWLDPLRMADIGDAVAEHLGDLDPSRADEYRSDAEQLRTELETLDQTYAAGLAGCARDTVVVSHDAFGYLSRYGLHFESIAGLSPGAEPTPAHLQQLQRLVVAEGVTTVFTEQLASPALAEGLAADLGLRTAVLDPVEGLADDSGDEDYLSLMRANLAALQEANGC